MIHIAMIPMMIQIKTIIIEPVNSLKEIQNIQSITIAIKTKEILVKQMKEIDQNCNLLMKDRVIEIIKKIPSIKKATNIKIQDNNYIKRKKTEYIQTTFEIKEKSVFRDKDSIKDKIGFKIIIHLKENQIIKPIEGMMILKKIFKKKEIIYMIKE